MLDAVLSPEWDYRYYSFNSKWGPGENMASMQNGSGDEYFILFNEHGAAMKGFDHESIMSPWSAKDRRIWASGGRLVAHLSDGSAVDYTDTTPLDTGQFDRNYTLTYRASGAGQTFRSWTSRVRSPSSEP